MRHLGILLFCVLAFASQTYAISDSVLETEVNDFAKRDLNFKKLLEQSLQRAQWHSVHELIDNVVFCKQSSFEGGRVEQRSDLRFYYFVRDLEGPSGNDDKVKNYYKDQIVKQLGQLGFYTLEWVFDEDFITLQSPSQLSFICLNEKAPSDERFFLLAHELVHFSQTPLRHDPTEFSKYRDYSDYCVRTILNPGDEAEAYAFEYRLRILYSGRGLQGVRPDIRYYFNSQGELVRSREAFANFILQDLNYKNFRMDKEYEKRSQAYNEFHKQTGELYKMILQDRQAQILDLQDRLSRRFHLIDRIWPKYRTETARLEGLLQKARESVERARVSLSSTAQ